MLLRYTVGQSTWPQHAAALRDRGLTRTRCRSASAPRLHHAAALSRANSELNSNHHRQAFTCWLPMLPELLTTAIIYVIVAEQINMGPRWLLPGTIVLLATILGIAIRRGHVFFSRQIAIVLLTLEQIPDWLRPADLTPGPPLQMGAGERNCRRVQPF